MSIRSRRTRTARAAVLLTVLVILAVALPARAAIAVDVSVNPLVGGRYSAGGWLALDVLLTNAGAPLEGYVAADTSTGTVRRFVELPAGARKVLTLYVRPDAFQRTVEVRFESAEGTATATAEVRVLERSGQHVAVVGDGGGNLRPQLIAAGEARGPDPLGVAVGDLPERPEPLHGITAIVWAADSGALSEAQGRSLERWVAGGGQLIVVGGPDWQARTAAFTELLPVDAIAGAEDVALDGLADFAGAPAPADADRAAGLGALRARAIELAPSDRSGEPLLAMIAVGAGRVVYSAVDLATPSYRTWDAASLIWSRLLAGTSWADELTGGFPVEEEAGLMSQALTNIPSLEVPPAELLLTVIVGYILLIGPISYLVLRRLDRRELAWISAPALIVLFSACSYGIGSTLKGGEIIVNQISIVRTATGGSTAMVEVYAGLFSPTRATYDLIVEADALVAPLRSGGFDWQPSNREAKYLAEQGDPSRLRDVSVGVFGFEGLRADAITPYTPTLEVEWSFGDRELNGTVTNTGEDPIADVAVISEVGGRMVGDLEPGEAAEFRLSLRNFNGTSASEGVYGFGGWDASTETQRNALVRRQVIDALVGYGGAFPGRLAGAGRGVRGPFVIGWRVGESPIAISVDGHAVRRHEQVVELVSGRPDIGSGEVRLDPGQLAVHVLSTDGDANASDPTFVTVGSGEVVFGIGLPLEVGNLVPSRLDILVGPEPSMVLFEPGGFAGFFPPGFTVSVRDATTGEWLELGDLSRQSRFEVDDPARALSASGRIEVRVVGSEIDANFGRQGVFASAEITGVVAP